MPASQGEINCENCLWPLRRISKVQNNSPIHWKEAASGISDKKIKLAAKKFLWSAILFVVLSGAQKISHAAHSLSQLGELHVKAGYVSTFLAG